MKPLLSLLLALFGAVCCLGAQLSTDTLPSPATIDSLQARIDRLERRADRWDRLRSRLPEFSGYVQLGYEYDGNTSSFLIRRAQFALAGSLLPSLHYNVRLEFASPQILDACLDYRPLQALNLRVGEFKVPFSIENTAYPPTKIEFIHYPMALLRLMGFADLCGLSSTGRDMGLVLHGSFLPRDGYNLLHYDVGVLNGEGINTWDRNSSKDFVARLSVHPVQGLTLSGSYYWGEYGPDYRRRVRYGAGVCYDRGAVVVRSGSAGRPMSPGAIRSLYGGSIAAAGTSWAAGAQPARSCRSCVTIPSSSRSPSPPRARPTARPASSGSPCGICAASSTIPGNRMLRPASPTATCFPSSLPECSDDQISF